MSPKKEPGMTLIVKTVTRLTVGLILIYGIYIVLHGHIGPGGGFAGGAILALSFIHLMLAYGKQAVLDKLNEARGILLAGLGAAALLSVVLFISLSGENIFLSTGKFKLFSAGAVVLSDIAASCMVTTALFVIFLVLILLTGSKGEK